MLVSGSTGVFHQVVDIDSHVSRDGFGRRSPHDDPARIDVIDHAAAQRLNAVPESTATVRSIPVPTSGFSGRRQGTPGAACWSP